MNAKIRWLIVALVAMVMVAPSLAQQSDIPTTTGSPVLVEGVPSTLVIDLNQMTLVQASRWIVDDIAFVDADSKLWYVPAGTYFAVTTENGRYEAVEPTTQIGMVGNVDYGWCDDSKRQPDCPPHLMAIRTLETTADKQCVSTVMDISYRFQIENTCDSNTVVVFEGMWNTFTRNATELMEDYKSAASDGDLGIFLAAQQPGQEVTVHFGGTEYPAGYACWDCLADTAGRQDTIVSLADQSVTQFGDTPTQPLGSSLTPGYVVPIPTPAADPELQVSIAIEIPAGESAVIWLGRYDVQEQTVGTQYRVVASTLNVRPEPNTDNDPLGSLRNGDVVTVEQVSQGWGFVRTPSGVQGWISLDPQFAVELDDNEG